MALKRTIDSNITGLAYAEEAELGSLPGENSLPGTPEWHRLEPNSYNDFGGEIITVAPQPINPSRQRRKGVTTDLNAAGGFNHNFTYKNLTDLMQGVIFADIRKKGSQAVTNVDGTTDVYEMADTTGFLVGSIVKGENFVNSVNRSSHVVTAVNAGVSVEVDGDLIDEVPGATARLEVVGYEAGVGDVDVDVTGDLPRLTSTTLDFTTLGLVPGQWIFVGGDDAGTSFTNAVNNGFKRIRIVEANALTIDKSATTMVAEADAGATIKIYFGDVLKNETGTLVKRRSYNVERTLGVPDTAAPSAVQSEVLVGAIPNEFALNIPTANLANVDFSFLATDAAQRTAATGPKQASVIDAEAATEYNTSSDISRVKLSVVDDLDENPTPLFAYVTEINISINNNLTANKAVGVLGAFDVSAGIFAVSGSLTAYFVTVEAASAVRDNDNVTLDVHLIKDNTGIVIDYPLVSLGDARPNVELNQPITLPLNLDAARGLDVHANLDHTILITYFNYLPDAAE